MQIDWITVIAQIVNFLVLVYLLKRLLYRPVLDAMDRREQRIADRLNDARKRESEAEQAIGDCRKQRDALDTERDELLEEARQQAEARRRELLEQAREEAGQARQRYLDEVEREKASFLRALRLAAAEEITLAARRLLADFADEQLEERMVLRFIERLDELEDTGRQALAEAETIVVTSTLELADPLRDRLRQAVSRITGRETPLEFERSSRLLGGIELAADGYKVSWTIEHYLDALAQRVERQFGTVRQS